MATDTHASNPHKHWKDWPNEAGFNTRVERPDPIELAVQGTIPAACAGVLYRNGPACYKIDGIITASGKPFALSHWFDGFSHLHRFWLAPDASGSCRVLYNSRRQVDELIDLARKQGRLDFVTFAQKRDPCDSFFRKIKTAFAAADPSQYVGASQARTKATGMVNAGVTLRTNFPGVEDDMKTGRTGIESLTCMTDANIIKHVDPETLEPLGVVRQTSLHPDLKGQLSCAHAHFDPVTGDAFNYNLEFGRFASYRIFCTSAATGETTILANISDGAAKPCYVHSFFLSGDYIVLCLWPAVLAAGGVKVLWERSIVDAMDFHRDASTRWYVVDRKPGGRGLVTTFLSDAFFSFHTVNAWQEKSKSEPDGDKETDTEDIVCDIITYPDMDVLQRSYYDNMVSSAPGTDPFNRTRKTFPSLVRYRLRGVPRSGRREDGAQALPRAQIEASYQGKQVGDLPTINPRLSTRKTRFVYNVTDRGLSSFFDGLAKVDMETGKYILWSQDRHTPGEPIFVPSSPSPEAGAAESTGAEEQEDAGYLLSIVLDGDKGTSYLLCLDARTMTELGRADCRVPVGFGFHGEHFPASRM